MKDLTIWQKLILGIQHVAVMYGGAIVVPILIGSAIGLNQQQLVYLISYDLLGCGIATLMQTIGGKGFGIRLPAMMAVSFVVVTPAIEIGQIYSLPGIFGAVIAAGIIVIIISQFVGKILKYFPPLVTGSVVLIIGITLMPEAMKNAAGGSGADDFGALHNLLIAALTLVLFFVFNYFFKGFLKSIAVLLALAAGTIVASFFGMVGFQKFVEADWVTLVQPFHFGVPEFHFSAILTMSIVALVIMVESTGVFYALGEVSHREIRNNDVKEGLRAEGIAATISAILNGFNHSTFSQNVGLVYITKVTDRYVVALGGLVLVILGLLPKMAAIATMIPSAVLGGAMIPMFGMLVSAALQMIGKSDMSDGSNQLVVALGVAVGLAIDGVPSIFDDLPSTLNLIFGNGIIMGTIVLFLANLILNGSSNPKSVSTDTETTSSKAV